MILRRLKLENFKNFGEKEVLFSPGINVLQGPNGSGKTTILEGIEFALYGSVTGRAGLEPLVKVEETIASATLDFESVDDGVQRRYVVFRQISKGDTGTSSTRVYITRDEVEVSTRKSTVDDQLLELVGIGHSSFGNSCYIRQGEIRALLEAGKEREREIDRMIGLGVFEDAWRDLRKTEAELEKQASSAKEELIKAEAGLESLDSVQRDLSKRMEEKIRIQSQIRAAESELSDLPESVEAGGPADEFVRLEKARAAQAQKVEGLKDQLGQVEDRIEVVNDRLLEIEAELLRRENRIESLRDESEALSDRVEKMGLEREKGLETMKELESEVSRIEAELKIQSDLISAFSQMEVRGDSKCPLCGSELTSKHARETRKNLDAKVRELQDALENKRTDLQRYERSEGASRSRRERIEGQLTEIRADLSEAEAQNSGIRISKEEIESEMGSLMDQKRALEREVESEKKLLDELQRTALKTPSEGVSEPKAAYLANKRILERLEVEIPELMEKLAEQQMRKKNLDSAREKHEALSTELGKIVDIRWAFNNIGPYARRKILPAVSDRTRQLFSQIYSGGLIKGVALTQDYDVLAEAESGIRLPSRHLSIGERVIAGLALRIALAQIWQRAPRNTDAGDSPVPGFLILDEPTEYLDEANVRTLARTLAGLKSLGQVIIVTHDRDLLEEIGRASEVSQILLAAPS